MSQAVATRRRPARGGNGHRAVVMPAKPRAVKPIASAPRATHRFLIDNVSIGIPGWVVDHASFRQWFYLPEFPEEGRVSFLNGEVIFDISYEQIFSHVRMKTEIGRVLANLAKRNLGGVYFGDGLLISHLGAEVSNNPDGVFVTNASFNDETVRLAEGAKQAYIELEGSPDMVLEVVSDSSVRKDCELLRVAYWKAGIREYWLVDARGDKLEFQILKHTSKGYSAIRSVGGWIKSAVFGEVFRLIATKNHLGHPDFELQIR
ncbi:MAG: Uma2 family endonuclease [Planctomycetaceae bacterium]|nr:Uma2 family endonuclease [Planctomycetaceae bacterium]